MLMQLDSPSPINPANIPVFFIAVPFISLSSPVRGHSERAVFLVTAQTASSRAVPKTESVVKDHPDTLVIQIQPLAKRNLRISPSLCAGELRANTVTLSIH
jgi:hypothetical protein